MVDIINIIKNILDPAIFVDHVANTANIEFILRILFHLGNDMFELLYLYIFFDDNPRQSNTPPTPADIACISSGILQVYRWYVGAYEQLTLQGDKVVWERVDEAELCFDAQDEIGEYHA